MPICIASASAQGKRRTPTTPADSHTRNEPTLACTALEYLHHVVGSSIAYWLATGIQASITALASVDSTIHDCHFVFAVVTSPVAC